LDPLLVEQYDQRLSVDDPESDVKKALTSVIVRLRNSHGFRIFCVWQRCFLHLRVSYFTVSILGGYQTSKSHTPVWIAIFPNAFANEDDKTCGWWWVQDNQGKPIPNFESL
jgi:hypothetical protein